MHLGKTYKLSEFLFWSRRQIYGLAICGAVPVVFYQTLGLDWLSVPLSVVALFGTATSFIVGFKNVQTYNRAMEAQQIWTAIVNGSRLWGLIARDFLNDQEISKDLIYRHLAWLTAIRYELRAPKPWESADDALNIEYRRYYSIPERQVKITEVLSRFLSIDEMEAITKASNKALNILYLQGFAVKQLLSDGQISTTFYMEFQRAIRDFIDQQGKAERIKNFPYPRQYATINLFFVRFFCFLFPYGLLKEFDKLNDGVTGVMHGHMVWLVVPFSVMVSWMYTTLEQVGQSTENPFEGGANDVPITALCQSIERDLRGMLGESALPPVPNVSAHIVL